MSSAAAVLSRLSDGARIVSGGGCGTPTGLLRILGEVAEARRGWELWSGILLGDSGILEGVLDGRLAYRTWHVVRQTRALVAQDPRVFVPLRGADVPGVLAARGVDALLVRVSPPDQEGWCTLGTSPSYVQPLLASASVVVAEIDPTMPRTRGESAVHVSSFHSVEQAVDPVPEYVSVGPDEVAFRIAAQIVPLLPAEPTLQLGLGAIPESLASLLVTADLGPIRAVGMVTDSIVDLAAAGRLYAGPGPAVEAIELMGTRRLLDWAGDNSSVAMYPVTRMGTPEVLGARERVVSVVSAVEVDISGQCNLEWVGRQISGVGGAMDFAEGARASVGGLRIVAMPSTARGRSRIVRQLAPATPVSLPRHSVDVVVTEHGVARLAGRSLAERAEALRSVAHPAHAAALVTDEPAAPP